MRPEEFLKEFGGLAETEGGISQLRRTIRQLSVMGRLVDQNINDIPAGVLVREAQEYRQQKLGKKAKAVPEIADAEWPYHLPYSWVWVRLGELTWRSQYGTSQKAHTHDSGIPVLRMGNIVDGTLDYTNMKFVSENTEGVGELLLEEGDLIFNRTNSFEQVGKMAVFGEKERPITLASYLIRLSLCPVVLPEYVNIYFGTPVCRSTQIEPGITKQTNQANFNATKLATVLLPLPPLPEQKRIVEKVDQLMALCDELEAKQKQKQEKAVSFNKAALNAVVHAPDKSKLKSSWSRVQDHFEVLYELPENVKELRQTILQLAVMGKLVKQDGIPPLTETLGFAEHPAKTSLPVLPVGWCWLRVEDIAEQVIDCLHSTPKYSATGYPAIRTADVIPGTLLLEQARTVSEQVYVDRVRRLEPRPGDIFYSREGERFGIAALVPEGAKVCLAQRMMHIRLHQGAGDPEFFMWAMNSPHVYGQAVLDVGGSTSPHVNMKAIRGFSVPCPPPKEQSRIASKVRKLFALCGELEASLAQHRDQGQRLMQAVVESLVA